MAKRKQRQPLRYEKDPIGCIWGLISIFDFRNGRLTPKVLINRRRNSRLSVGTRSSKAQLLLTNSDEKRQILYDGSENKTEMPSAGRTSVKDLMDEEMISEQELKKLSESVDVEGEESYSEQRGLAQKSRKGTMKTNKRHPDVHVCDPRTPGILDSENSCHQVSEQKTSVNLDLEVIMEELCHLLNQKSTTCTTHDGHDNLDVHSNPTYPVSEEKLREALKVFADKKSTNEKHLVEDGKFYHSEKFADALKALNSNEESFFKLLKDPNSLLVKCIQDLRDAELESARESKPVEKSKLLSEDPSDPKQSEDTNSMFHNFFRRRSKSQERNPLEGNENRHRTSSIFVLKPRAETVENCETGENLKSPLRFHHWLGNHGQGGKITNQFSFTEIKRKLQHAMGKDRHFISSDSVNRNYPDERQNLGNGDKGSSIKNGRWRFPYRTHFYTERIAKPSTVSKTGEKIGNPKDNEAKEGNEASGPSEQRIPNIYIEARKHLSEILSYGGDTEQISGRQSPKTLGRLLSLSDFNASPICSPRGDRGQNFVTAQMRLFPYNNIHIANESGCQTSQEKILSNLGSPRYNVDAQSCATCDNHNEVKPPSPKSNLCVTNEPCRTNTMDETLSSISDNRSSEGDVEIVIDITLPVESKVLDVSAKDYSSLTAMDGESATVTEISNEEETPQCSKSDSCAENQSPSSPLASPSTSSIAIEVEDLENANEKPAQPSPVSVLEPLLTEDDISPPRIKNRTGEKTKLLLPIRLEEEIFCSMNQGICVGSFIGNEESTFEYVEAVLLGSDLNWDEYLSRWLSSEEPLEPSLFDEVELFSGRSHQEQKLLFDCTNEALKEVCERYFGYSPWLSFVKNDIRPVPRRQNLINEVWKRVEWHLLVQPPPGTLDQIVRKDMELSGTWMDLRPDTESVINEMEAAVFEELIDDLILSFVSTSQENEFPLVQADLMGEETNIKS